MERILLISIYITIYAMFLTLLLMSMRSSIEKRRRKVQHNLNKLHRKAHMRLIGALISSPVRFLYNYLRNTSLLESYNWYRSLSGNWTDSHAAQTLTPKEICMLDPVTFRQIYFGG